MCLRQWSDQVALNCSVPFFLDPQIPDPVLLFQAFPIRLGLGALWRTDPVHREAPYAGETRRSLLTGMTPDAGPLRWEVLCAREARCM